jgi:AraC-like DNA-binding protein
MGEFYINGKRYTATEGDVVIFNVGQFHEEKYNSNTRVETYYCGISNLYIEGFKDCWITPDVMEPIIHLGEHKMIIENIYEQLFKESRLKKGGFTLVCNSLTILLIVNLLRIANEQQLVLEPSKSKSSDQLVSKIKDYLNYNYHQKIILAELAQHFHINVYYLSHLFKKATGYSIINYLINRRIDESKVYLVTTELTINEISNIVGYESSNNFFSVFKKITGLTPENYRRQSKISNNEINQLFSENHEF